MWEYNTFEVGGSDFRGIWRVLDEMGQQGWEAVSIVPVEWKTYVVKRSDTITKPTIGVLLKRRVSEE
jgi:hypothetical protein